MKKLFLLLGLCLLTTNLWASAPSRTYTYTAGELIDPAEVTANEDVIFTYLQNGVDTIKDNSIVNADINASAAISYSKLSLSGSITNTDIASSAGIVYSKLTFSNNIVAGDIATGAVASAEILNDTIVNEDINSSAAIVDTKLATISTAGKVLGAALNTLSGIPSGAGQIPVANLGTGTPSATTVLYGNGAWTTLTEANTSNVIFQWTGFDGDNTDNTSKFGYIQGTSLTAAPGSATFNYFFLASDSSSVETVLFSKFVKIAGVSTITINAKLWAGDTDANRESILTVNVGGQSNTVKSVGSATPAWVTASTIDVSGLTNGTTYDITISLNNENAGSSAYCSAVVLTGS